MVRLSGVLTERRSLETVEAGVSYGERMLARNTSDQRSRAWDSTRMTLNDASFFHCIFTSTYAMDRTSPASGRRGHPSHRCIATVLLFEKSRWIEPRPA
ncbi:hypothetical protein OsI_33171 [Oryza sativa Indica Group]|uniref:Uncharacterized protein n=1 Tax=Oryza sativa subsp. indica TaxID=39946 RepID=B8BGC8_ORYSI|nr:hypothetical protein OsI_33171 [Oryza sativa Indica Group]